MRRIVAALDRLLEDVVAWLDHYYLGSLLRVLAGLAVALIPTAQAFSNSPRVPLLRIFADPECLWVFFLALALLLPLHHYHRGSPVRRLLGRLASINGSFAGALAKLGDKVDASDTRQLTESECEGLCAALLHRIRDYAAVALDATEGPELRATLAVPFSTSGGGAPDSLRVWCYDQTYQIRAHTIIPFHIDGKVAPGAPAAYYEGTSWEIIDDIEKVPGIAATAARPYRSVVSFAVPAKTADGRPLAVISIDADLPNFFRAKRVLTELRPLVSPVASAIGLVLASRLGKGGPYGFPP
jgi:hypothetical protein